MKNLVLSILLGTGLTAGAESLPDSVVMKVADKSVSVAEFLYIAQKNAEVDLKNEKSVKQYVELFKNFKLKVAAAEQLGLDRKESFKNELEGYRAQLVSGYLSDKPAEEAAARVVYDRGNEILELSHILFRLPEKTLSKDTVAVYQQAMAVYEQLQGGADLDQVGQELFAQDKEHVAYEHVRCFQPMQSVKAFEEAAYALPVGVVSRPVRTKLGFHLIKVTARKPHPGLMKVAHILLPFPKDSTATSHTETRQRAEEVYAKLQAGGDFAELAKQYSGDGTAQSGGVLPWFGPGEMIEPFEKAAYTLQNPGQLSGIVETRFGFHIIQLIDKSGRKPFDDVKKSLMRQMGQGERNFELYQAFDERMKQEYGYVFYPEAYAELQALCNDYFPSDRAFYEQAEKMEKTLMHLDGVDFPQNEFAYYLQRCPFSTKTYAGDFMWEVYNLFIRDIVTTSERKNLEQKHPEMEHLMQEYREGMLLFEISNQKIWSKPAAEQAELEKQWVEELNKSYPVEINWRLLKKLGKK